jgi:hypothetical protein
MAETAKKTEQGEADQLLNLGVLEGNIRKLRMTKEITDRLAKSYPINDEVQGWIGTLQAKQLQSLEQLKTLKSRLSPQITEMREIHLEWVGKRMPPMSKEWQVVYNRHLELLEKYKGQIEKVRLVQETIARGTKTASNPYDEKIKELEGQGQYDTLLYMIVKKNRDAYERAIKGL